MRDLGVRLKRISELVPFGAKVCDVGTDHGYLAAELVISGRASSVVATDVNLKPLENAKRNFEKLHIEDRVRLVLCDGLSGVTRNEADTVIIAGMGGDVISGIISRCDFLRDSSVLLILQPMTAAETLRRFLAEYGFQIESENAVSENGKIYSVMCVRFSGESYAVDGLFAKIGKIDTANEENRAYIKKQYDICMSCALDLEKVDGKNKEYSEYKSTALKLKELLEGQNGI